MGRKTRGGIGLIAYIGCLLLPLLWLGPWREIVMVMLEEDEVEVRLKLLKLVRVRVSDENGQCELQFIYSLTHCTRLLLYEHHKHSFNQ